MKNFRGTLIIFVLAASALACNFPNASQTATETPSGIDLDATVVAISMEQTQTSIAAYLNPTRTLEPAAPTRTQAQETLTAPTTQPSSTTVPSVTPKPKPCNAAMFIADITYEDNTKVDPGDTFTKTWRLENVGTCTWNSSYRLVYDHGDKMGAANSVQLTNSAIAPGMTVDASVELIAPDDGGTYQGYFLLRSGDGEMFGINATAIDPFWVLIKVPNPTAVPEQKAEIEITNFDLCAAPKKGVPCQVSVSVYNNGTKKTGPYQIQFYQSDSAPAGCTWNMDNNAKGGQSVSCMYTFPSFYNNIKTRVVVDVGNVVPESDEGNNVEYLTVDVDP